MKKKNKLMKSPLSPCDIEVLIHYYSTSSSHPRIDAGAIQESTLMFRNCGMIKPIKGEPNAFEATPKGSDMVESLCNTPEARPIYFPK